VRANFLDKVVTTIWRQALATLANVFAKGVFWNSFSNVHVNERQRLMLNRLFDGFEGKLTTEKWQKVTKSSQRTAIRDIQSPDHSGRTKRGSSGEVHSISEYHRRCSSPVYVRA
jgi:Fic family protein